MLEWLNRPTINFSVSAISQVEVLGYHKLTGRDKEDFDDFFSNTPSYPITTEIIQLAVTVHQQCKRSPADGIIAATARSHGLPVVTHHVDDFSTIDGLTVISLAGILAESAT
ncbi:type II toxin-antitoxin system VapC family toxin [Fibrella arboris]|uniref:type II toxin-antitoxin system VapC family toxin n=1 Tax=Fibrella arboris TaxID=3242486 RepID=UPI003521C8FE